MDFLKSGLKSVLGAADGGQQMSGAETVERLVDRVISSTLLEDRRDACRALKALSRQYRVEVGAQGMPGLLQVLEMDRADCEIVSYALDTLCFITSTEQFDEESYNPAVTVNIGEQFTEMFLKQSENVVLVLGYLEEYDFRVRWASIKLLTGLLAVRPKELQEIVLVSPMAVSKLMDLLSDSREVIRNDALLLLIQLTKANANIQKIVAFENAFDRLFDVIREEGCSDGGIVVEDCLILMLNLLKNNTSNQQFFKEGSFIQKLSPMLAMPPELEETGWTPQKISNVYFMLQIARALVSPTNTQQVVAACQRIMNGCGLLEALCAILMGSGVPPDTLTETINTVAEVVRGNLDNQTFLSGVLAPSNPPRSALVVLLMSMVNEKQPLVLRCSVLYCFECFLYRNEIGQTALVQTLLPSSTEVSTLTSGQLLCGGLFSPDVLANWFSSVSLMHALLENPAQKEQLLRVLLATSAGSQPVSLLHQAASLLQQSTYKLQAKIGILMLLCVWLSNCPLAVRAFLSANGSISYLIAQINANEHDDIEHLSQGLCAFLMAICIQFNDSSIEHYKRDDLCQLIVKRIGVEMFSTKLGEVSKHESYSRAGKQPQLRVKSSKELLLDYEFCKLFKALEAVVSKTISGYGSNDTNMTELTLSSEASGLVDQYKEIIREQDVRLQKMNEVTNRMECENELLRSQLNEALVNNSQINDQNTLLRAQLSAGMGDTQDRGPSKAIIETNGIEDGLTSISIDGANPQENMFLMAQLEEMRMQLIEADRRGREANEELDRIRRDQEDLLELLADQDVKAKKMRNRLKELGATLDDQSGDEAESDTELVNLQTVH